MDVINVGGLQIEVTRKNIKRINMRIRRDGRVTISAPYLTPGREIVNFVASHSEWIESNRAKVMARAAAHAEPTTRAEKERLRVALAERIAGRLPAIEQRTGLRCSGWSVRDMKSRWGRCNTTTGHINFSLMLADRTDDELDYVILHELAHTVVANHGPEFKAILDRYMPDWRIIRKEMRDN